MFMCLCKSLKFQSLFGHKILDIFHCGYKRQGMLVITAVNEAAETEVMVFSNPVDHKHKMIYSGLLSCTHKEHSSEKRGQINATGISPKPRDFI